MVKRFPQGCQKTLWKRHQPLPNTSKAFSNDGAVRGKLSRNSTEWMCAALTAVAMRFQSEFATLLWLPVFQWVGYAGKKRRLVCREYESIFGVAVSIHEWFDVSLKMWPALRSKLGLYELRIENACKTRAHRRFEHTIFMGGHKRCSESPAQLLAATAVGHKQMRWELPAPGGRKGHLDLGPRHPEDLWVRFARSWFSEPLNVSAARTANGNSVTC